MRDADSVTFGNRSVPTGVGLTYAPQTPALTS
jgi:hypothetical protein